ncbi:MAG: hypothetical protein RL226_1181 [Bacteroidota bacterium]
MDRAALMDRRDTKYILNKEEFALILPELEKEYRVLVVDGHSISRYSSQYFDTSAFDFYHLHQRGKKNRVKIRIRRYDESNISFLEVKLKTNTDRTVKSRIPTNEMRENLLGLEMDFIRHSTGVDLQLQPSVINGFRRITLVHKERAERITFDLDISFSDASGNYLTIPNLVIAELKQEKFDRSSIFARLTKNMLIRPESVSKYCLGVALLKVEVKKNAIKEKVRRIEELTSQQLLRYLQLT